MEQKNKNDVANKKKKKIVVMWKIVGTPKVSVLYIYIDEGIIGELNTSKETEIEVEACNEELSLAKEFGAAKLLGSGRNANKNLTPRNNSSLITRDNLSGTSSLKSHNTNGNRVHKQKSPHASCTWTRRERIKPKDNTTARVQTQGKKRMVALEVYHMAGSTK